VIIWLILAAMCVAFALLSPGQEAPLLMTPPLIGLMAWGFMYGVRLEIGESTVRVKLGWLAPTKQMARSRILAIHYYPHMISFTGPGRKPILRTKSEWSLRQMEAVARELAIPLYDHRIWAGMRTVSVGRLVYRPTSRDPVS
jgi:hypothetical protein